MFEVATGKFKISPFVQFNLFSLCKSIKMISRSSVLLTALFILNQQLFVLCFALNNHEVDEPIKTNEERLEKIQSDFMALQEMKKSMPTTSAAINANEEVTYSYEDYELLETTTEDIVLANRFLTNVPKFKCPPCMVQIIVKKSKKCRKLKKEGCPF